MNDFDYLGEEVYLDAACQSLRPRPVIEALEKYYTEHNSCGERVKYEWGTKTDALVSAARQKVLKYLKLSSLNYFVSFTLNTTYGINLILNSLDPKVVQKIYTSEIEHNSPFLATMGLAERLGVEREILEREENGSLIIDGKNFKNAVVVVNASANFDGRMLVNIKDVVKKIHRDGGIIIIDAAQTLAHSSQILEKTEADAICFSAHKMYSSSLGGMIVRRDLLKKINPTFLGGGMVDDVFTDKYLLSSENKDHTHTIFEPGLQAWGEIIALGAAIDWLNGRTKADKKRLEDCTKDLYDFLTSNSKIHLVNKEPNPTMSFYVDGIDSHLLGAALVREGIMARTGYFCVHYYLDKVLKLPPLVRFSLSYATRPEDIERVKKALKNI